MTPHPLRRALRASMLLAVAGVAVPAAAQASTWTVDDDKAQCPNAGFTSIQPAVNQAAPWDTIIVCDGTYEESSAPATGSISPAQTGSRNGLTITKPLTIKGTGASKVTIKPAASIGDSLAGTAPYLRDGGGNVITISKQAAGSTDDNEMFVAISGVTVTSPNAYAEAGIAFFNTSGSITNSVVGPFKVAADATEYAARPHGWGVVMTNFMQGAEAGIRRSVDITGSLVTGYQSGGVLFDDSRGADGAPTLLTRSGIVAYGTITSSKIQGAGPQSVFPQTGVQWHAGQRGSIAKSSVTGNYYEPDPRMSVGLLLTDAETGNDPAKPSVRGFWAIQNHLTQNGYAMFNANAANDDVRLGAPASATPGGGVLGAENWWGCSAGPVVGGPSASGLANACQGISGNDGGGAASIERGATMTAAPFIAATPAVTPDAVPSGRFGDPLDGDEVPAGTPVDTLIQASDDFGVRSVALEVDGDALTPVATIPYAFAWTPPFAKIGSTIALKATITDSAGQTTTKTVSVKVVAPAGYDAIDVSPTSAEFGEVLVGESAAKDVVVTNTGQNPLTLTDVDLTGGDYELDGDCADALVLAPAATCTAKITFKPSGGGAKAASLKVTYTTPGGGAPEVVALNGTGKPVETTPTTPTETATTPTTTTPTTTTPTETTPTTTTPTETTPTATTATETTPVTVTDAGPPAASDPPKPVAPPVLALSSRSKVSKKTGWFDVGKVTCPTGQICTVKLSASLKVAGTTLKLRRTVAVAGTGKPVTLRLKLSSAAKRALATSTTKRVKFSVSADAKGSLGATATLTRTLTVRG